MLSKRYLFSVKNLPNIMQKIIDGTAPDNFTLDHLQGLGFKGSADRAIIPVLKELLGSSQKMGFPLRGIMNTVISHNPKELWEKPCMKLMQIYFT